MKDERKQCKKHHESTIGKIIYGFLMFMPLLAIGVTCLYTIFNKNAKDSYYGETINEELYTNLQNNTFEEGKTYYVNTFDITRDGNSNIYLYDFELINAINYNTSDIELLRNNNIYRLNWASTGNIGVYKIENDTSTWLLGINPSNNQSISFKCKFYSLSGYAYKCIYDITYNKDSFVSEAFYYSLEQLKENSVFNWASTSFLVQPFQYIVNLFGMNTNNVIVLLLSYWLDISIIWLVFDVIMYVPLLIHRWLDKGVIS